MDIHVKFSKQRPRYKTRWKRSEWVMAHWHTKGNFGCHNSDVKSEKDITTNK